MTNPIEKPLNLLEESRIYLLREVKSRFRKPAMLWSTGKDSMLTLQLCRLAFFDSISFPKIHIDNGIDFPETYTLREHLSSQWNVKVLVAKKSNPK